MLLLAALVATAAWSYGFSQEIPVQSPISVTKFKNSVRMTCKIQTLGENFDRTVIHWYQQKEGKAPERVLFFSEGKVSVESGFQENKYMVENISGQKRCVLTINNVLPDDTATYYCAYWDPHCDRNSKIIKQANMLLLAALVATAAWSYGFSQEIPVQSPISVTKFKNSVRMTCKIQTLGENFDRTVIHWYQQKEGKAPERVLFFSEGKVSVESGFQENKYMVENISGQKRCVLTINNVLPDDTATYYCAYWHMWTIWIKYFGTGTKLIVSDKEVSPPADVEILQKKHENQIMYVCLIEKFYPEVIRVTWTDGKNEVTDNVVKGDVWKPTEEDKYSIGSWLTVPLENKDKIYHCEYNHESKQSSLSTQDSTKTVPQGEDCSTYPANSTVFNRDHLMHRAAYLVYIVLLLKSFMYYFIVLFFIYRMWAPTKHQGKKA
ncbi:T-cell receptor gamma alternate reading frame protein [Spheniscus humboldti]